MKVKVCGMGENYSEVVALQPDFLGFIFWKSSVRYFEREKLDKVEVPKVGVFVDQSFEEIMVRTSQFDLDYLQLHGYETPEFCMTLSTLLKRSGYNTQIIKAFAISDDFDFSSLRVYEGIVSTFLFDAKGELPGGNGIGFNWEVLKKYDGTTPFFLSGGIGLEDVGKIKEFLQEAVAQLCSAIDVNSKFELRPGVKNVHALEAFLKQARQLTIE